MSSSEKPEKSSKALLPSIGGYIAAFIALGGWSAFNWQSHGDLNSKIAEFERYKTTEEGKLRDRELAIEKLKISLDVLQKGIDTSNANLAAEQSKLATLSASIRERELHVADAAKLVGSATLAAKEEAEINALATQVSQLGVNLRGAPPCDPDELRRYNQGRTLVSQISARARASNLLQKFDGFIQSNSPMGFSFTDKCK